MQELHEDTLAASLEVREDLAALFYALHAGGEVAIDQDHVGGLLQGVQAGHVQGNTQIGSCERGAVVDAVAGDADDVTEASGALDDLELVPGARYVRRQYPTWWGLQQIIVSLLFQIGYGRMHSLLPHCQYTNMTIHAPFRSLLRLTLFMPCRRLRAYASTPEHRSNSSFRSSMRDQKHESGDK
jgi:hypothetical protein